MECKLPGRQAGREKISKVAAKISWQTYEEADYSSGWQAGIWEGRHVVKHKVPDKKKGKQDKQAVLKLKGRQTKRQHNKHINIYQYQK
jgi:hypothetical protein